MSFQLSATFINDDTAYLTGISDVDLSLFNGQLMLHTTTSSGRAISAYQVSATDQMQFEDCVFLPAGSAASEVEMDLITIGGTDYALPFGYSETNLTAYELSNSGMFANSGSALAGQGYSTSIVAMDSILIDGQTYIFANHFGFDEIAVYSVANDLSLTQLQSGTSGQQSQSQEVSDIATVQVGGQTYVYAAFAQGDQVAGYVVASDGTLQNVETIGADQGLGINTPTSMTAVTTGDTSFLIVGAAGSNSLSVMQIGSDGGLVATDHVIDSLDTRFESADVLQSVEVDDRAFLIAGGADDGLSLFGVMPDGRLIVMDSVADTTQTTLGDLSAADIAYDGGSLIVAASSETEAGITTLTFDPGNLGITVNGSAASQTLTGSAYDDIIAGGIGDEFLAGAQGDDILIDGFGNDQLSGGEGSDLFFLTRDGQSDEILDFDPQLDRLDLSGYTLLHDWSQISVTSTADGAVLTYADDVIILHAANDQSLVKDDLLHLNIAPVSRVPVSAVSDTGSGAIDGTQGDDTLTGSAGQDILRGQGGQDTLFGLAGDDRLEGGNGNDLLDGGTGADALFGGAGQDVASYASAAGGMVVDLSFAINNTGQAAGDSYNSIENLTGSSHDDDLRGSAQIDLISGADGDDILHGRNGNDTLLGGDGQDILLGGAGSDQLNGGGDTDRAAYWSAPSRVTADLQFAMNNSGEAAGDSYLSVEDLQGTGYDDDLRGDSTDNRIWGQSGNDVLHGRNGQDDLYGGAGDDLLLGGSGADFHDGGEGIDRAAYWNSSSGLVADLQFIGANTNDAAGDQFSQIEGLQGTNYNDDLRGDANPNSLMGLDGTDTLHGRDGDDHLAGGNGNDILLGGSGADLLQGGEGVDRAAYWSASSGVVGHLGRDRRSANVFEQFGRGSRRQLCLG